MARGAFAIVASAIAEAPGTPPEPSPPVGSRPLSRRHPFPPMAVPIRIALRLARRVVERGAHGCQGRSRRRFDARLPGGRLPFQGRPAQAADPQVLRRHRERGRRRRGAPSPDHGSSPRTPRLSPHRPRRVLRPRHPPGREGPRPARAEGAEHPRGAGGHPRGVPARPALVHRALARPRRRPSPHRRRHPRRQRPGIRVGPEDRPGRRGGPADSDLRLAAHRSAAAPRGRPLFGAGASRHRRGVLSGVPKADARARRRPGPGVLRTRPDVPRTGPSLDGRALRSRRGERGRRSGEPP